MRVFYGLQKPFICCIRIEFIAAQGTALEQVAVLLFVLQFAVAVADPVVLVPQVGFAVLFAFLVFSEEAHARQSQAAWCRSSCRQAMLHQLSHRLSESQPSPTAPCRLSRNERILPYYHLFTQQENTFSNI